MDGKRVIAKAYAYSAANRVMFQTGLYCFPQDDIIGYGEEKEIEETESTQNTLDRVTKEMACPRLKAESARKQEEANTAPRSTGRIGSIASERIH